MKSFLCVCNLDRTPHSQWHCQRDFVFLRKNNQITASSWNIVSVHKRHSYLNHKQWLFCVRIFNWFSVLSTAVCADMIVTFHLLLPLLPSITFFFVPNFFSINHIVKLFAFCYCSLSSFIIVAVSIFNTCYVIRTAKLNNYVINRKKMVLVFGSFLSCFFL